MLLSKNRVVLGLLVSLIAATTSARLARAEEVIKVGVLAEMSGPFAPYGKQITTGMKAYMKVHGDKVAGKKIELVVKDTTGPVPDVAKRLAQELVTRDKVQVLAGFGLTPNALAVAPVATEAKIPMVIMNAATSVITTKSPYIVRVSFTLPQVTAPIAAWALKNKIKKIYTLVSDYGPGLDAESTFKKVFTAGGGEVVGGLRVPLKNPDFAPFVQRIKDAKPEGVFIFTPAGEAAVAFMKASRSADWTRPGSSCWPPATSPRTRSSRPRATRRSAWSRPTTTRPRTNRPRTTRSRRRSRTWPAPTRARTSWRWADGTECTSSTRWWTSWAERRAARWTAAKPWTPSKG
jgi:branched-chain amino acid transport system substrate-binding protein